MHIVGLYTFYLLEHEQICSVTNSEIINKLLIKQQKSFYKHEDYALAYTFINNTIYLYVAALV